VTFLKPAIFVSTLNSSIKNKITNKITGYLFEAKNALKSLDTKPAFFCRTSVLLEKIKGEIE
jgi:hypothetical protein